MMFFRLWRKLVKLKIFFLETAKSVLAYAIKNNKFAKKDCLGKSLKLTLFMSLKYTAHFA